MVSDSLPTYQSSVGDLTSSTESVTRLVNVTADLSRISATKIPQTRGADGKMYYQLAYDIEVTYYSAYTKYELIYQKVNYGSVTAEYV